MGGWTGNVLGILYTDSQSLSRGWRGEENGCGGLAHTAAEPEKELKIVARTNYTITFVFG